MDHILVDHWWKFLEDMDHSSHSIRSQTNNWYQCRRYSFLPQWRNILHKLHDIVHTCFCHQSTPHYKYNPPHYTLYGYHTKHIPLLPKSTLHHIHIPHHSTLDLHHMADTPHRSSTAQPSHTNTLTFVVPIGNQLDKWVQAYKLRYRCNSHPHMCTSRLRIGSLWDSFGLLCMHCCRRWIGNRHCTRIGFFSCWVGSWMGSSSTAEHQGGISAGHHYTHKWAHLPPNPRGTTYKPHKSMHDHQHKHTHQHPSTPGWCHIEQHIHLPV